MVVFVLQNPMTTVAKLTPDQMAASRESVRQYVANMAIEGMYLTDYERQFIEKLQDEGVGADEAVRRTLVDLKARGIIPDQAHSIAAE